MGRYHMRRSERAIVEQDELGAILGQGRYITLALCRADEPYAVTMSYGYDAEQQALFFHCAHEGLKLDFLRHNPQVCGTVIEDLGYIQSECAHAYRSVVLRGEIRLVNLLEEKVHGMEVLLRHLEDEPQTVRASTLRDEAAYDRAAILRLDIHEITGKQGR
ncbi:MAG TPA: pyridoxamine 5'-phosphate oxidase family protein [Anaerolineae bacterium]|nr:pyridoxamine 5'-phosphate oxidase family protein [Anaerolineae bacterium]